MFLEYHDDCVKISLILTSIIWFHLYLQFPSPIFKLLRRRQEKKFPQQSTSLKKKWERLDSVLNINFHFIQIEKWWNISYKLVIIDKDMFPLCSSMTDTHIHTEPLCIEWWWDERAWREKENYLVMSPRTLKLNL